MKLRRVLHLPLAALAACVLLPALALDQTGAATTSVPGDAPAPIGVLYPPDGAILTVNPALIVVVGPDGAEAPDLQLDGSPLRLEKMTFAEAWKQIPEKVDIPAGSDDLPLRSPLLKDKAGNVVWVTAKDVAEGEHSVTLDGAALASFSSRPPKEADARTWDEPVLRVHGPPGSRAEVLDCGRCHQSDSPKVLGVATLPESCHACHDDVDLSLSHEHVMEFLEKCHMCHDPHAATRPSLLIDRREVVCAQCHESGYAR